MSAITVGDSVTLSMSLTSDGVAADPTALVLTIRQPNGVSVVANWPSPAEITRLGVGSFEYVHAIPFDNAYSGVTVVNWRGTGAAPGVGEVCVSVNPAKVLVT